jgi:hypothetical protein
MRYLNYERLLSISNSVTPYRGSLNRFPIGNRKESTKYFIVGSEEGNNIFNIVYGSKFVKEYVSKEKYDMYNAAGKAVGYESGPNNRNRYYKWNKTPDVIGLVRPDNSFEFVGDSYFQGCNSVMSSFSTGKFSNDSRRGGLIYCQRESTPREPYMLPIYKGLRVDCNTMRPLEPIVVTGKHVDRKASKALMAGYKDFYTVAETMCKVMDIDSFLETAKSIKDEYGINPSTETGEAASWVTNALIVDKPIDAMFLYMLAFNSGRIDSYIHNRNWGKPDSPMYIFDLMKRRLNKHLYESNKSIFNDVIYKGGDHLPSSEWGYELTVNGKQVIQYGG